MNTASSRWRDERGAVLVMVAVCLVVLTAFSALTIDYGVLWVGRAQAQTAADAGAHAGAIALAFDAFSERGDTGPAKQAALALARQNLVWLESAAVNVTTDITFPTSGCSDVLTGDPTTVEGLTPCIRVDVHRSSARGNPLPTFFARLVGVESQSIRATATAQVVHANMTECLTPLAIPDRWFEAFPELGPQWQQEGAEFHEFSARNVPRPLFEQDDYDPPSPTSHGTGFRVRQTHGGIGFRATLREVRRPYDANLVRPFDFVPIDLRRDPAIEIPFQDNVESCFGVPRGFHTTVAAINSSMIAAATGGARRLYERDPTATWNPTTRSIQNSCAPACAPFSPRLIALPVFDVSRFDRSRYEPTLDIHIVNIVGFFIEEPPSANEIVGRIAHLPGFLNSNRPTLLHDSAFLRTALLVR
jgi:Flp pilus assembly protein TadG